MIKNGVVLWTNPDPPHSFPWIVGNRVQTINPKTIRLRTSTTISADTLRDIIVNTTYAGEIKQGPVYNATNGFWWYRILWDDPSLTNLPNNTGSWVGADNLESLDPNTVPVATPQSLVTSGGAAIPIILSGTDANNNTLTYTIITQPTKGTLSGTAPNITYTPSTEGSDLFTFLVNDGVINSAAASIVIVNGSIPVIPGIPTGTTSMRNSVTKDGITWNFSALRSCGQYCNGDWFVVGPVTITSITPLCVTDGTGWTRNGTEVNPIISYNLSPNGSGVQGFDNSITGFNGTNYAQSRNVAPSYTGSSLIFATNATGSVVSSISRNLRAVPAVRPQLTDVAVLTVVAVAPDPGSFRPPYVGTNKASYYKYQNLNYSFLKRLAPPVSAPTIASTMTKFDRLWFQHMDAPPSRWINASNNLKDYGQKIAQDMGEGMMMLHLDFSDAQKAPLLIALVQMGIDMYEAMKKGMVWWDNGGHHCGRKAPLLLAAIALNDAGMKTWVNGTLKFLFHDDRQTFIVRQSDVGRVMLTSDGRPRATYNQSHVGMAEWGEKHIIAINRDGSNWNTFYRDINGSCNTTIALTVGMCFEGRSLWNWEPYFKYYGRYWSVEGAGGFSNQISVSNKIPLFHFNMLELYASTYLPHVPHTPVPAP